MSDETTPIEDTDMQLPAVAENTEEPVAALPEHAETAAEPAPAPETEPAQAQAPEEPETAPVPAAETPVESAPVAETTEPVELPTGSKLETLQANALTFPADGTVNLDFKVKDVPYVAEEPTPARKPRARAPKAETVQAPPAPAVLDVVDFGAAAAEHKSRESRPLSREKRWRVTRVIEKAK